MRSTIWNFRIAGVTRFIALDKTEANKALTQSAPAMVRQAQVDHRAACARCSTTSRSSCSIPMPTTRWWMRTRRCRRSAAIMSPSAISRPRVVPDGRPTGTASTKRSARSSGSSTVLGFTTIRESVNSVEAWLGSLPGHVYANVRQPLVHTLNLAHLMPLSSVWAGPARNDHLDGAAALSMPKPAARRRSGSPPMSAMSATC